jgi:hypothetical protein
MIKNAVHQLLLQVFFVNLHIFTGFTDVNYYKNLKFESLKMLHFLVLFLCLFYYNFLTIHYIITRIYKTRLSLLNGIILLCLAGQSDINRQG